MPERNFTRVGAAASQSAGVTSFRPAAINVSTNMAAARAAPLRPAAGAAVKPVRDISDVVATPKTVTRAAAVDPVSIEQLRVIQPAMWAKIGRVRPLPASGATRESLGLPVAPAEEFTDVSVFEAAVGPQRYYLPRYKLALRSVSGVDQYVIRIEKAPEGDWVLRATLEKAPPPGVPAGATELTHEILLQLVYPITLAGGGSTVKELPFQEVTESADQRSITAVLRFASPAERDQALSAITQQMGGAGLKVTRSVRVATPLGAATPQQFRPVTRGLPQFADPNPLSLNLSLHHYLFEGQAPSGATPGLVAHQVQWGGRYYPYWQDAVRPELFYYLPDAFRLARRGKPAPYLPMMSIRVESGGGPDAATITLEFVATPFIDPFRIEDARKQLAKHLSAKSPPAIPAGSPKQPGGLAGQLGGLIGRAIGGETGKRVGETLGAVAQGAIASQGGPENAIVFEPMPVKKAALWLAVTGVGLTEQPGAQIEARAAIYHSLSMPIAQFQAVFDALMGGSVTLMRGELRLDLGTAMSEIVPLELRFDRMSGELFTLQAARDPAAPHAMDVHSDERSRECAGTAQA